MIAQKNVEEGQRKPEQTRTEGYLSNHQKKIEKTVLFRGKKKKDARDEDERATFFTERRTNEWRARTGFRKGATVRERRGTTLRKKKKRGSPTGFPPRQRERKKLKCRAKGTPRLFHRENAGNRKKEGGKNPPRPGKEEDWRQKGRGQKNGGERKKEHLSYNAKEPAGVRPERKENLISPPQEPLPVAAARSTDRTAGDALLYPLKKKKKTSPIAPDLGIESARAGKGGKKRRGARPEKGKRKRLRARRETLLVSRGKRSTPCQKKKKKLRHHERGRSRPLRLTQRGERGSPGKKKKKTSNHLSNAGKGTPLRHALARKKKTSFHEKKERSKGRQTATLDIKMEGKNQTSKSIVSSKKKRYDREGKRDSRTGQKTWQEEPPKSTISKRTRLSRREKKKNYTGRRGGLFFDAEAQRDEKA